MARVMEIKTPLGEDELLFLEMSATDELGRPFIYRIEVLSTKNNIDPGKLLGKNVTVKLELPDGGHRYFDGYVSEFGAVGTQGRHTKYRMLVQPWLWLLTLTSDCRIFQDKTVPEIIKEIFDKYPNAVFENRLTDKYRKWEYCVQYRETDLNFVSRLMELEGIYFFFNHADNKHTLILADSYSAHEPFPGYEQIPFIAQDTPGRIEQESITGWEFTRRIEPGKYVLDDYDFKKPSTDLQVRTKIDRDNAEASHEQFDYPGAYVAHGEGEHYVRVRLEGLQAERETAEGKANARGLAVGRLFKLTRQARADQNREYLVVSAHYHLAYNAYEAQAGAGADFTCGFTALSSKEHYRSKIKTAKPHVQGPQTAVVVGPAGDEIHTDNFGRVKVQFHWDRYGKEDENSSCWIRVSSSWAGKAWGETFLPRIGQEVIVDFLEGDPDQPIITGRVYNAEQMPAAFSQTGQLPTNHALGGIHSRELKGNRYNELLFDDTPGEIRVKLSSEHAKTQLNLGYLIHPRNGGGEARGEGFELRTDDWGSLRAAKGLFLTTDRQAQAVGGQLSRTELIACLEEALSLAKSLASQASDHQAGRADTAPQEALAKAAADWGHGSNAEKGGSAGGAGLIAASAPEGIALTTPKDITSFSGQHTDLVAQKNHQFTSGQQTHVHAGTGLHLYANSGGVSSIANQGKHVTQAQHDDVVINAEQSIHLTASKQHILAAAEEHITLTAGGAYIKLQGGNIELGCPGSVTIKAGSYNLVGPASMQEELPKFVQGDVGRAFKLHYAGRDTPVPNTPYKISLSDGRTVEGVSDAEGHTQLSEHDAYFISKIDVFTPTT